MCATRSNIDGCGNGERTGDTFLDRGVSGGEAAGLTWCIAVRCTQGDMIYKIFGKEGFSSVHRILGAARAMPASNGPTGVRAYSDKL